MDRMVNKAMSTNGARQPKACPKISPTGIPSTIDPLTPIDTIPIARPRYSGSTILGAITKHKIISKDPLNADIIRPIKRTVYVGLKIVTKLPTKKINNEIRVNFFLRSEERRVGKEYRTEWA